MPVEMICQSCGSTYYSKPSRVHRSKYCGFRCKQTEAAKLSGDSRRRTGTGYVKLHQKHEHRVVGERMLGRPLKKNEVVHHRDGNQQNNAEDNLEVMTRSAHSRLHSTKNRKCTVVGCERRHCGHGFCEKHLRQHYKELKSANSSN